MFGENCPENVEEIVLGQNFRGGNFPGECPEIFSEIVRRRNFLVPISV